RDHFRALVVLLQPGDDDGGVQASGVGQDDLLYFHRFTFAHCNASSMMSMPFWISFFVMTSGGAIRSMLAPVRSASIPFCCSRARRSFTSPPLYSNPRRSPRPRISPTLAWRDFSPSKPWDRKSPDSRTRARKPGWPTVSHTLRATAVVTGPPPNVVPWSLWW